MSLSQVLSDLERELMAAIDAYGELKVDQAQPKALALRDHLRYATGFAETILRVIQTRVRLASEESYRQEAKRRAKEKGDSSE